MKRVRNWSKSQLYTRVASFHEPNRSDIECCSLKPLGFEEDVDDSVENPGGRFEGASGILL
jgi:hypothetical protein